MLDLMRPNNWRHELAAARVREAAPETFLDVGTGTGWLLRATNEHARGTGVEADPKIAAALRELGMDVRDGDAERLPFFDREFDMVVLRNVLHHLRDPGAAIAEGRRVCRRMMLITEPWFDQSIPSQRLGQSIDAYTKRVERHTQRFHADYIDADAILEWLDAPAASVSIERHVRLEERGRSEWLADIAEELAALPPDHPLLTELGAIDCTIATGGAAGSATGSATAEGVLLLLVRFED